MHQSCFTCKKESLAAGQNSTERDKTIMIIYQLLDLPYCQAQPQFHGGVDWTGLPDLTYI